MAKMWTGRTDGITDKIADDFNSSIKIDSRMFKQDILGSMAHATMLGAKNIIPKADADVLIDGLEGILNDIESGKLEIDYTAEDIHMFIEQVLTERVGEVGKKLHTARSRNDQVALDSKMYLKDCTTVVIGKIKELIESILFQAQEHKETIMPGYTHLQRAQPITFGHHLMAYSMMLLRDIDRFNALAKSIDVSPIGCCALAGTTYDTDRQMEAQLLGFSQISQNSIDGVSDRDFCIEFSSNCAILMMHLSRLAEEIILWSSWEFKFVELDDAYTTGSSIMPQKKNSDMAELVRGKTGRVYGNLMSILTILKGLPLAYNKDMQEDKEGTFDSYDTVIMCLEVFAPMIKSMKVLKDNMLCAAKKGFINATDLADYMVKKGLPFRTAYKIVGQIVGDCIRAGKDLETLTLEEYKKYNEVFEQDLFSEISLITCVKKRISVGGTSPESVDKQIKWAKEKLSNV